MGVRGRGATPAQAFEQAALAMTAVMTEPEAVAPQIQVDIACEAPDLELLFADWLNALVFETATRKMFFSLFSVHISGNRLTATAWGEPINGEKHQPRVEVKGATYTDLKVYRDPSGTWVAQCVVDV